MKIVVDMNILISTLIKSNGKIGTFLLKELEGIEILSCYYLYIEIFDKKEKIKKYSKLTEVDLLELLYMVIRRVTFVNEDQISKGAWKRAKELTQGVDVKDISFVALTLEMNPKLWTGDKKLYAGLREKGFHDVLSTQDLKEFIKR